MSTLAKHEQDTRRRLLWPDRDSLDSVVLIPYIIETIDELNIKRNNTREPSLIAFGTLTTDAGRATYPLDNIAPNYGKARYLWTKNETNDANFQRQWVEMVDWETLVQMYGGGDAVGAVPTDSTYPLIPAAAAVYSDVNLGNMLEFAPIPSQVTVFDFVYEVAALHPQSKDAQGFRLPQFDALVAAKSADRALVHCKWQGLDKEDTKERKKEIRFTLDREIGSADERRGLEYLFWQHINTGFDKTYDTSIGYLKGVLY